jgi:hypothetical protein
MVLESPPESLTLIKASVGLQKVHHIPECQQCSRSREGLWKVVLLHSSGLFLVLRCLSLSGAGQCEAGMGKKREKDHDVCLCPCLVKEPGWTFATALRGSGSFLSVPVAAVVRQTCPGSTAEGHSGWGCPHLHTFHFMHQSLHLRRPWGVWLSVPHLPGQCSVCG